MKLPRILMLLLPIVLLACEQEEEISNATAEPSPAMEVAQVPETTSGIKNRYLQTSFGKIAVSETGQSPATILFVHGNSSSKAVFSKQFNSSLADNFRLVAFDLPGHGDSENAEDSQNTYTIQAYAKLVGELVNMLELQPLVIVGWSLGGHIAIEAAAQGLTLNGIVISGTPPVGPGLEHMGDAFKLSDSMGLTGKPDFTEEEVLAFANESMGGGAFVTDEIIKIVARTDGLARQTMVADWSTAGVGHDQRQFVEQWPGPIAVLQGQKDAFVNGSYLQELEWKNLWRGKIHFLDDMGHAPFWQDAEQFNMLLSDFLQDIF